MEQELLTYGPLGLFCVVLMYACKTMFDMYVEVQEKRIEEGLRFQNALIEMQHLFREMRDALK